MKCRSLVVVGRSFVFWVAVMSSVTFCVAEDTVPIASLELANQPVANAKTDTSADGHPLTINGQAFDHGLGVSAPAKSSLT